MPDIVDDKSEYCIPFILENMQKYNATYKTQEKVPPFVIGLNGVQGAGKSTLVTTLAETLRQPPHSLPTVVLSIDDLYLPHDQQAQLASIHSTNPLIQHRGQPSTHDIPLGISVFSSIKEGKLTKIPQYDKSAYQGQGDRVPEEQWPAVNEDKNNIIKVIIFEGWCVGFRPMPFDELRFKWESAVKLKDSGSYNGRLGWNTCTSLEFVNKALRDYEALNLQLDVLINIDAEDPQYVYKWRQEQEAALRKAKGAGMTDDQVIEFVNGYYPTYELYTDQLRKGMFINAIGKQLRLVVGKDRKVRTVIRI